jgi:hypothetical protein
LKRHIGASVQVASTAANRLDEFLGAYYPGYSPAGQTEALGQAIDEQDVVFVDVLNVLGGRNGRPVAVRSVVVAAVELVHYEGCAVTADVLDFSQLGVLDHLAGWIAGVAGRGEGVSKEK